MATKTFWSAFFGAAIGKLIIGLFIAVCVLLGFGPERWATFMISALPLWVSPVIAQRAFLVLTALAIISLLLLYRSKLAKVAMHETASSNALHEDRYPNIRVADSEVTLNLFIGPERTKLIALLEGGHVKAWARSMAKGQSPPGVATDLLMLSPDTWSKHRLEHMPKGGEGTIAQTFLKNDRGNSIYYDVCLNSLHLAEAFPHIKWQASSNSQVRRIPIKEFIEIAGKSGWDLDSNEILDLERGGQQDALFGDLTLWGRRNFQRLAILNVHEPLQEIPKDHWKDFKPQLLDAMNADKNIYARSWSREFSKAAEPKIFLDLHIDGSTSIPWLTGNGLQYKGWNAKNEKERLANR